MRVFEIQEDLEVRNDYSRHGVVYISISRQVRLKRAEIVAYRGVQPKADQRLKTSKRHRI
jgi:hypothetical protein